MTEKSPLDEQWDDLMEDWQSQPYEKVDIDKLVKQMKKRTFFAKAVLFLDVIATISLFSALYYVLTEEPDDVATAIYVGIGAVGSLIYTIIEFNIRIKTWRLDASDPKQAFEKNISGLKGAIQYANLWIYSCYIMFPMVNWYIWELGKTTEKSVLPAYLFANGLVAIMIIGAYLYKAKRVKELEGTNKTINE